MNDGELRAREKVLQMMAEDQSVGSISFELCEKLMIVPDTKEWEPDCLRHVWRKRDEF